MHDGSTILRRVRAKRCVTCCTWLALWAAASLWTGCQRVDDESRALAKARLLEASAAAKETLRQLDALDEQITVWEKTIEPLLTNEEGMLLAADPAAVKFFVAHYHQPRIGSRQGANFRARLMALTEPIDQAIRDDSHYQPSFVLLNELEDIKGEVDRAVYAYQWPARQIQAAVARARSRAAAAGNEAAAGQTLAAAMQVLEVDRLSSLESAAAFLRDHWDSDLFPLFLVQSLTFNQAEAIFGDNPRFVESVRRVKLFLYLVLEPDTQQWYEHQVAEGNAAPFDLRRFDPREEQGGDATSEAQRVLGRLERLYQADKRIVQAGGRLQIFADRYEYLEHVWQLADETFR